MTLPTREEAARYVKHWGFGPIREIAFAYADGVLMTREEWLATIDYQYILDWAVDVGGLNYRPNMQEIKDVFDAALGDDDE